MKKIIYQIIILKMKKKYLRKKGKKKKSKIKKLKEILKMTIKQKKIRKMMKQY